ncbi:hypothetical protein [Phycicoccus flavus]|uniref:Uncharacterized protein n=1 Tax=Phycicoccus flavus TaxID=2502783 RepID=A0A8T6QZP9_9MICO|nr:hypothetical protein [Phycicoccus flavus]NHA66650.1 hypothetical protein [Phycicoccus flavus]
MTGAEEFGGFVAARWPEVEAVALAATLDPAAARETTTAAFATLHAGWAEANESGAPTAAVRRALLAELAPRRRRRSPDPLPAGADPVDPEVRAAVGAPEGGVEQALLDALARETVAVRAAGAAALLWDLPAGGLESLLGPSRDGLLADVGASRGRLLEAHRAGRVAEGLGPADDRLDTDLADVLHRVADVAGPVPDPEALVRLRTRRLRRRHLLVAAAGLASVGAGGTAVLTGRGDGRAAAARPSAPGPSTLAADDPRWSSPRSWPARGALAADPRFASVLTSSLATDATLLYAHDVEGLRVALAATDNLDGGSSPAIILWNGPAGTPAERLSRTDVTPDAMYGRDGTRDVVAVGVPHEEDTLVLVLARPGVGRAEVSGTVDPRPDGTIVRTWTGIELRDGVGTRLVQGPLGVATRLRCDDFDGALPRVFDASEWDPYGPATARRAVLERVAAATGLAPDRVTVSVTRYRLRRGTRGLGSPRATGTLRVVLATLPGSAVVRSTWVETRDRGGVASSYGEGPLVIPAAAADAPAVQMLYGETTEGTTMLVVGPPAAATVQVRGPSGGDRGRPVRVVDGVAVLREPASYPFTLRVRDADGRILYDDEPVQGRDLLDLWDL